MDSEKLYNSAHQEAEAQRLWDQEKTYHFNPDADKPVYSIDTPPPTVSGTLHIGHVFSYTHADLVARYKRMKGFNVFYPMGFDDNGLPTERFVEKRNSTKAHLMKRSEFIALCLKETGQVEKLFEDLWRKMGLSFDWTKTYSTISDQVRRVSQASFLDLYRKGLVYRQEEPSLYCTTCRTSVAQAELDSADVASAFNDIMFRTQDGQPLMIATTRPELLGACVAIFYHPEDERYKHLNGQHAIVPIYENAVRLIPDEKVDPAKGTGLVMCCTFGDQTDIHWYKTHKLPYVHVVGFDGKWTKAAGLLEGLPVHEARKKILELLAQANLLHDQKPISHHVNTHERCKQEIEYVILSQWFVKILDSKEKFLELADQIEWKPEYMKARYKDWVQNLGWNWCISRQRFFGIPFPVWHCQDCEHVIIADESMLPIDPQEQAYPGGKCPACSSSKVFPDTDVMDTWNTSSLTPQINVHWPDQSPDKLTMPMSMRPQAHDIIRTWAFYTIVKAFYHHGSIPWNTIVISGHVLAGKEKISKSRENSKMTPESLLSTYPADVIRYWSANGRLGSDTAFSENQLKIGQRLVTKLWNAFRFLHEHVQSIQKSASPVESSLNQWIMDACSTTYAAYQEKFDDYDYQAALEAVEKFFWHDFCDNYLELVKDQLFNPDKYDAVTVAETKQSLYEVGFALLQMFAPFLPHITESLYQSMYRKNEQASSLHITTFDNQRFNKSYQDSVAVMTAILSLVAGVRKIKSEHQLSLKTEIASLIIHNADKQLVNKLMANKQVICGVTKAMALSFDQSELAQASLEGQVPDIVVRMTL